MWRWLLLRIPLGILAVLLLAWLLLPWPVLLRWEEPDTTAFMRGRLAAAEAAGEPLELRHEWVPLEEISPALRRAVVAAEDGRFHRHGGIDWIALGEELRYAGDDEFSWTDADDLRALLASFRYYRENRAEVRGRSTITQQLAKNLYFDADRSLFRKGAEFFVARRLERFLSKERILEIYLNVAEWGPGVFGAEAAARHHFGRSASELTLVQAAALAASLPHPLTSNPSRNPGRMAWRRDLILSWMRETPEGAAGRDMPEPPSIPRPEDLPIPQVEAPADASGTEADVPGKPDSAAGGGRAPDTLGAGADDSPTSGLPMPETPPGSDGAPPPGT